MFTGMTRPRNKFSERKKSKFAHIIYLAHANQSHIGTTIVFDLPLYNIATMTICNNTSGSKFCAVASLFLVLQLQWMNPGTAFVLAPTLVESVSLRLPSQRFVSTIYSDFSTPRSSFSRDLNNQKNKKVDGDHDDDEQILVALDMAQVPTTTRNHHGIVVTGMTTPDHPRRLMINQLEIPIKRQRIPTANEIPPSVAYLGAMEMTVGRIAMVVAALLMITELTTGMSLPQQLAKVLLFY